MVQSSGAPTELDELGVSKQYKVFVHDSLCAELCKPDETFFCGLITFHDSHSFFFFFISWQHMTTKQIYCELWAMLTRAILTKKLMPPDSLIWYAALSNRRSNDVLFTAIRRTEVLATPLKVSRKLCDYKTLVTPLLFCVIWLKGNPATKWIEDTQGPI